MLKVIILIKIFSSGNDHTFIDI